MRITIRPATVADVDILVWVCCGTGGPQYKEDYRHDALEQIAGEIANSTTYVIWVDDTGVGRLRVVRTPQFIEIAGIQIHPTWQNRGIGTEVITGILKEAGNRPVELDVSKNNPNAERLYTRLGFTKAGEHGNDYRMRLTQQRRSRSPNSHD
jgi:ribosomal protein S18 acetylase RimI-like enzyme